MNRTQNKVLIVAYFFPPLGGGGVPRSVNFVKYLPSFGWTPVVLTSNTKDYHAWDKSYFQELPENLNILRTRALNLKPFYEILYKFRLDSIAHYLRKNENRFLLPDRQVGWFLHSCREGLRTIDKENIGLIYSSAPPFTGHLVARFLKQKTGLPWVADFRDEWADYGFIKRGRIGSYFQKRWEKAVLQKADVVVSTTSWITKLLQGKLEKKQGKFITITNGYDRTKFERLALIKYTKKLVLAHAGSFYGSRVPDIILETVADLIQRKCIVLSDLQFHFIGDSPHENQIESLNLPRDIINSTGYLPHPQTLQKLSKATALILLQSSEGRRCIPGKVYEYLALKKPILALIPKPSAVADLLTSFHGVYIADINNPCTVADGFLKLYYDWKKVDLPALSSDENLDSYEYKNLTRQLANVFFDVSNCRPENSITSKMNTYKKKYFVVGVC